MCIKVAHGPGVARLCVHSDMCQFCAFFYLYACLSVCFGMYACVCVFVSVCPALWSIELCDEAVQAVGVQMVYRRPEDSQPVHDSHSASQQLSLPPLTLTLSLSPWWPRKHNTTSVYVCDCRRQQKMQTELSVCMCLFL